MFGGAAITSSNIPTSHTHTHTCHGGFRSHSVDTRLPPPYLPAATTPLQNEAQAGEEQVYSVEEDPSQPECAISGEPFERFYDPDSDKWCYKDAVLLAGEDAAK